MPLIAERPRQWDQVVGQDRVLRVLHALLRNPKYMTRGFIFEGPWAVGKTTTAYLFGRALICQGEDPLGCGTCPSCVTAAEGPGMHCDFREVDAAKFSSVADAKELLSRLDGGAQLGKRVVVILDEAHRMSPEAFDQFLKPLEARDTDVVFIFVTSEGHRIPGTIVSRCSQIRFDKVDQDALTGMLMIAADREGIRYRTDGLQAIARFSQGRPRDAIKGLGLTAALGEITPRAVADALNFEAEAVAQDVLETIVARDLAGAIKKADGLAQRIGPVKVIEALFTCFTRDVYSGSKLAASFAPLREMSAFFIKWSTSSHLPGDVMPLFVVELNEMRSELYRKSEQEQTRPAAAASTAAAASATPASAANAAKAVSPRLTMQSIKTILGAKN